MQRVGTPLLKQGNNVDKVYFFYNGTGVLQRQFNSKAYGHTTVDAVILPEGSFFGELDVILNTFCFFTLKAGAKESQKNRLLRDGQ